MDITRRYVENLPEDTTVELLHEVFKRYGLIMTNIDGTPKAGNEYCNDK